MSIKTQLASATKNISPSFECNFHFEVILKSLFRNDEAEAEADGLTRISPHLGRNARPR